MAWPLGEDCPALAHLACRQRACPARHATQYPAAPLVSQWTQTAKRHPPSAAVAIDALLLPRVEAGAGAASGTMAVAAAVAACASRCRSRMRPRATVVAWQSARYDRRYRPRATRMASQPSHRSDASRDSADSMRATWTWTWTRAFPGYGESTPLGRRNARRTARRRPLTAKTRRAAAAPWRKARRTSNLQLHIHRPVCPPPHRLHLHRRLHRHSTRPAPCHALSWEPSYRSSRAR